MKLKVTFRDIFYSLGKRKRAVTNKSSDNDKINIVS